MKWRQYNYEEIYEYQFDLMDAMAAYVRSSVALDAAKEINTEFEEVTAINILFIVSWDFHVLGGRGVVN